MPIMEQCITVTLSDTLNVQEYHYQIFTYAWLIFYNLVNVLCCNLKRYRVLPHIAFCCTPLYMYFTSCSSKPKINVTYGAVWPLYFHLPLTLIGIHMAMD
jgi:hypothetical protein